MKTIQGHTVIKKQRKYFNPDLCYSKVQAAKPLPTRNTPTRPSQAQQTWVFSLTQHKSSSPNSVLYLRAISVAGWANHLKTNVYYWHAIRMQRHNFKDNMHTCTHTYTPMCTHRYLATILPFIFWLLLYNFWNVFIVGPQNESLILHWLLNIRSLLSG